MGLFHHEARDGRERKAFFREGAIEFGEGFGKIGRPYRAYHNCRAAAFGLLFPLFEGDEDGIPLSPKIQKHASPPLRSTSAPGEGRTVGARCGIYPQ